MSAARILRASVANPRLLAGFMASSSSHGGCRRRQRSAGTRRSGSSMRCAPPSPSAARRARRSTTWPREAVSRAGSCTTTSAPRSSCWSRWCGATRTSGWPGSMPRSPAPTPATTCWRSRLLAGGSRRARPVVRRAPLRALHIRPPDAEIAAELARSTAGPRARRRQLDAKAREGVISPTADAESVVTVLLSLADGLACACSPTPVTTGARRSPPRCRPRERSSAGCPFGHPTGAPVGPSRCASASVRGRGGRERALVSPPSARPWLGVGAALSARPPRAGVSAQRWCSRSSPTPTRVRSMSSTVAGSHRCGRRGCAFVVMMVGRPSDTVVSRPRCC